MESHRTLDLSYNLLMQTPPGIFDDHKSENSIRIKLYICPGGDYSKKPETVHWNSFKKYDNVAVWKNKRQTVTRKWEGIAAKNST